jgi:hypothetical protein
VSPLSSEHRRSRSGHSLRGVRAILDTHYLSRDPKLGDSAIAKLEWGTRSPD